MKIIVDAFGGDNAPLEIIKGCAQAVSEFGIQIILTGSEKTITEVAKLPFLRVTVLPSAFVPEPVE